MQYCTELQTVLYWVPALCETTMSRRPCGLLQAPPERPRSCLSREFDLTDATRVSFRDLLVAVHRKIGAITEFRVVVAGRYLVSRFN